MPKKLIITADDFGLVNHIDDGIIDLVSKGIVSCVSSFGNVETLRLGEQIAKLINANPNVGIGIHLTVTSHLSVIQEDTTFTELIDGKRQFKKPKEIDFDDLLASKQALEIELKAQIENLKTILEEKGKTIDHISCHHNILYLDKELFELLIGLASEQSTPIRSPKRCTILPHFKPIKALEPLIPEIAVEGLRALPFKYYGKALNANSKKQIRKSIEKMEENGINSSTYFFINLYGNPEIEIVEAAYSLIEEDEICEQIMHLSDGNTIGQIVPNGINEKYFDGRKLEYDLLNSANFQIFLQNSGLTLGSFQTFIP